MDLQQIIDYAIHNNWDSKNVPDRIRCFFTTWAYENLVDEASAECESALKKIYNHAAVCELMEYEDFKAFMVKYLDD